MTRDRTSARPERDEPPFAADALVIKLGDPEGVVRVVEAYRQEHLVTGGIGAMLRYVDTPELAESGAKLTPIYPERALQVLRGGGPEEEPAWKVAVPDYETSWHEMSAYHFMQLARGPESLAENARLEAELLGDPRVALVYHPAIPYLRPAARDGDDDPDPQWGLTRCGFRDAWPCLDQGPDPGPIGVVDEGGVLANEELQDILVNAPTVAAAGSSHASAVIGVLAARRNEKGMDGCCSAKVRLFEVYGDSAQKAHTFILALKAAAGEHLRVVNVSHEMEWDQLVAAQVRECIGQGMIIVAAMGNENSKVPSYPARYDGVIAVGATNRADKKHLASNTGKHIWISAPGARIYTIASDQGFDRDHDGTSYAAPMVSAAAWLALRARPGWSPAQIRDLLARSVAGAQGFTKELGHGRLDMRQMMKELDCPP